MRFLSYSLTPLLIYSSEYNQVYYEFGNNLGTIIPSKILSYLLNIPNIQITSLSSLSSLTNKNKNNYNENTLILSFGNTNLSKEYSSIELIKDEGYNLNIRKYINNSTLITVNGKPINQKDKHFELDVNKVHYGAAIGSYAVLEQLGFTFLHPLQPYSPKNLYLDNIKDYVSIIEEPYWEKRIWHIHTMHPLEFTEVLNGYDIPMFIDFDKNNAGLENCPKNTYCETWESMYENLPGVFEWLLANKQNRVEVLLLGNQKWDAWDDLTTGKKRQDRLRKINDLAHEYGILMGADIPIALMQQHGWAMINVRDDFEKQSQDIINRVTWAFDAHYDFISTESGLSEFTKPSCDLMLNLFEVYTSEVVNKWGREAITKVHCSTDQFCTDTDESGNYKYTDPRTNEPINFNFLPTYASNGLGVLPHTVQVYSFDDPTAGAYGNENFSYMSDYMMYEASLKKRDVIYYGETAYWVNVDIDVPLFLPLSGQRRLYDLRKTAKTEKEGGYQITGQMNFESGWEFGYYISNVVCARAAWNPIINEQDDWIAFEKILSPILTMFGEYKKQILNAIVDLSKDEAEILIYGRINGKDSIDLTKLSGHAYMSGSDTWVDLPRMLGLHFTQPDKVHLDEPNDPLWDAARDVLTELETVFTRHSKKFQNILSNAKNSLDENALSYLEEITDLVELLRLRAKYNGVLYKSQDPDNISLRSKYLLDGRRILEEATTIIERRVSNFRVPSDRIAGWRAGPTTYPMGYVWSAKTLYFWWRDQGIAEQKSELASSACYLNRMQSLELVFGKGKVIEEALRLALKKKGHDSDNATVAAMLADCLAPPLKEFQFPRDL